MGRMVFNVIQNHHDFLLLTPYQMSRAIKSIMLVSRLTLIQLGFQFPGETDRSHLPLHG